MRWVRMSLDIFYHQSCGVRTSLDISGPVYTACSMSGDIFTG